MCPESTALIYCHTLEALWQLASPNRNNNRSLAECCVCALFPGRGCDWDKIICFKYNIANQYGIRHDQRHIHVGIVYHDNFWMVTGDPGTFVKEPAAKVIHGIFGFFVCCGKTHGIRMNVCLDIHSNNQLEIVRAPVAYKIQMRAWPTEYRPTLADKIHNTNHLLNNQSH